MNDNVIPFKSLGDCAITAERSPEFYNKARELSDFIAALPLTREQNDKLIGLMIDQVNIGEKDAFFFGGKLMLGFSKYEEENE